MKVDFRFIKKFFQSCVYRYWLVLPVILLFLAKNITGNNLSSLNDISIELAESPDHESCDNNEESKYSSDHDDYWNPAQSIELRESGIINSRHYCSGNLMIAYFDIHTPPPELI